LRHFLSVVPEKKLGNEELGVESVAEKIRALPESAGAAAMWIIESHGPCFALEYFDSLLWTISLFKYV